MAKSREQKVAEALGDGVRDRLWDHQRFAFYVLAQPLAVQWEILRSFFVVVKEWRKKSDPTKPYHNFSGYTDIDVDMTETEKEVDERVDLTRWDT